MTKREDVAVFESEAEAVAYGWYLHNAYSALQGKISLDDAESCLDIDVEEFRNALIGLGIRGVLMVSVSVADRSLFVAEEWDEETFVPKRTAAERRYAWSAMLAAYKPGWVVPDPPVHPQLRVTADRSAA